MHVINRSIDRWIGLMRLIDRSISLMRSIDRSISLMRSIDRPIDQLLDALDRSMLLETFVT
jgi:hypothetical protein